MRTVWLFLALVSLGWSTGPFTLSNLSCVRTHAKSDVTLFGAHEVATVKKMLEKAVKTLGFAPQTQDCPTLMVRLDALDFNGSYALFSKLALGEEVIAQRKTATETFVLSYEASDIIQTNDPKADMIESVQFLIDEFVAHVHEDRK